MTAPPRAAMAVATAVLLAGCGVREDPRRAQITHALLEPYAAAVAAGDLDAARERYTSAYYQQHVSDIVFLAGQARNRDTWGALKAIRLTSDAIEEVDDPALGELVRVSVVWEGATGTAPVVLDLDHDWHIVRSYAWPPNGVATERVF